MTTQGEHGVGLVKRDYLPHELGESTVAAMRQVWTLGDRVSLPTPRYTIGAAY